MKVKELMSKAVVQIEPDATASAAARKFTHYNIGALPVCTQDGKLCGMLTDRDLVTRCIAAGRPADVVRVRQVMTGHVVCADPEMDVSVAAHLMGRQQVRRLPVVENGKLCGMLTLGDLAKGEETAMDAADALGDIASNISDRSYW